MWLSRGEYRRLLRELTRAEQRAAAAESALVAERAENRTAERWWGDALLRAKQSLPLSAKADPAVDYEPPPVQPYDEGELAAVIAQGAEYGVDPAEARSLYLQSKGLTDAP